MAVRLIPVCDEFDVIIRGLNVIDHPGVTLPGEPRTLHDSVEEQLLKSCPKSLVLVGGLVEMVECR